MHMSLQRTHLLAGLVYGLAGMGLGVFMAATRDHSQMVTHAHLLLVGFLLSILYAIILRLWIRHAGRWLLLVQLLFHHLGVIGMVCGLFLLYGGHADIDKLDPLLASSSIAVLLGLFLMLLLTAGSFLRAQPQSEPETGA